MNEENGSATAEVVVRDLQRPGMRDTLIATVRDDHEHGRRVMVTIAAACALTGLPKKAMQGRVSRGSVPSALDATLGKRVIDTEDLRAAGIYDPQHPGQPVRPTWPEQGQVVVESPYPSAPPATPAAAPASDVAVATVTVDLNRHLTELRSWFEEAAGERERLIAEAAAAAAREEAARDAARRAGELAESAAAKAERLAAELIEQTANYERERAERLRAEDARAAAIERSERLEARVGEIESAPAEKATARRRSIFGG